MTVKKTMTRAELLCEAREQTGMTRREFAEFFDIPYRTVQDWERGVRNMPAYLLRLMIYRLETEKLVKGLDEVKIKKPKKMKKV